MGNASCVVIRETLYNHAHRPALSGSPHLFLYKQQRWLSMAYFTALPSIRIMGPFGEMSHSSPSENQGYNHNPTFSFGRLARHLTMGYRKHPIFRHPLAYSLHLGVFYPPTRFLTVLPVLPVPKQIMSHPIYKISRKYEEKPSRLPHTHLPWRYP